MDLKKKDMSIEFDLSYNTIFDKDKIRKRLENEGFIIGDDFGSHIWFSLDLGKKC